MIPPSVQEKSLPLCNPIEHMSTNEKEKETLALLVTKLHLLGKRLQDWVCEYNATQTNECKEWNGCKESPLTKAQAYLQWLEYSVWSRQFHRRSYGCIGREAIKQIRRITSILHQSIGDAHLSVFFAAKGLATKNECITRTFCRAKHTSLHCHSWHPQHNYILKFVIEMK